MTRFEQPLRVELRPSWLLGSAAAAFHLAAAASCLSLPWPLPQRLLLIALLAGHFGYFLRRQVTASARGAIRALAWDRLRGWRLRGADDEWLSAWPLKPMLITSRLVVARFRAADGRLHSAVILADRLGAEAFRRLRVRLLQCVNLDAA